MWLFRAVIVSTLFLCLLPPRQLQARDLRVEAIEQLLLTGWSTVPDDMVVEVVLDPVMGKAERYRVLRFYIDKQKSVGRHRAYIQQTYLPRLEKMIQEMPADDPRSQRLILQAMADLCRERDSDNAYMRGFLEDQLRSQTLSSARRATYESFLSGVLGRTTPVGSDFWKATQTRLTTMLAGGAAREAYNLSLSVLSDSRCDEADRLRALQFLDQLLARPTGVTFERVREDFASQFGTVRERALADALVRSTMRVAFLERLDTQHVLDMLHEAAQNQNALIQAAAKAALAELETERQEWGLDLPRHQEQADRLVAQANLDASAREEYRQMMASQEYYGRPVGESPRWWILGKFLWRHGAVAQAAEAFRTYLRTREECTHLDDSMREAIKIMAEIRRRLGQEPSDYWWDVARLPRAGAARAFIKALVEQMTMPEDRRSLAQLGARILRQSPQSELAQSVLWNIMFTEQDIALLESPEGGEMTRECRTAIAATWVRSAKYAEAVPYLDASLADPLPGVPLFRAAGMADTLFAKGMADKAERLTRALLRRNLTDGDRVRLLVYLMNQHLETGRMDDALGVQEELSQQYCTVAPQAVISALTEAIAAVRNRNADAEIASMRLLCQVINGDTYGQVTAKTSEQALTFWRSVLVWSRDNAKTDGLEDSLRSEPESVAADLGRVLLARTAIDQGHSQRATQWLKGIDASSPVRQLAAEERRRLTAIEQRNQTLATAVCQAAHRLADAAREHAQAAPAVEAALLLAEFEPDGAAKAQALSAALQMCRQHGLDGSSAAALEGEINRLHLPAQDEAVQTLCRELRSYVGESASPGYHGQSGASQCYEGPFGLAYIGAVQQIAAAFRAAGEYRRAAVFFHRGFAAAPFCKGAAHLLREEAWTLRFCLAAMEESDARFRQLMAIYPRHSAAQWARAYVCGMMNPLHPE